MMNRWLTMKRRKSRRNLHNSSKRQKNITLDLVVDRISALPDSILGSILSLLPTTNAVATSILSKRWRFMWKTVHNLAFGHLGRKEGDDMKFVEFVNRVLLLHDNRLLNKFLLFWKPGCNSFHFGSWIKTAITRNVHELAICVETRVGPDSSPEPVKMPISVFSCGSLRDLLLDGGIYFSEADVICLPRLEGLKLVKVDFESEEVFEKLISGSPMLNYLHLQVDNDYMVEYFGRGEDFFTYRISSTSVKRLELCFCYDEDPREDDFYCSVTLETPSLEYLRVVGYLYEINVQKRLSSLVEAEFRIDLHDADIYEPRICDSVVELVRAFDCAKTLLLSGDAMWALSLAEISLSTEFKRLVKLETVMFCCHCCVAFRDFIRCSDNLEVLTINQDPYSLVRRDLHVHSNWEAPIEVPICLSNSLKKVVLNVYCGFTDEREMIRYMLKHGSALEVMRIKCDRNRDNTKFELVQEICKFPRKSPACEVEFVVDQSGPNPVATIGSM